MPRERKEETMNAAWLDAAFAPVCENSYRTAVRVCETSHERAVQIAAITGSQSPSWSLRPFCSPIIAKEISRGRYHRLSVIQRFNVLCDRSQIRI
jgi:hypothetical protein